MGTYINIGNIGFQRARNSEYIDKSGLISVVNATLNTERGFTCATRGRRFGKSMAAKMLCAYYDQSCNSKELFTDLEIAKDPAFEKYLNKFPVIFLDISDFVTRFHDEDIVAHIDQELIEDIHAAYPDVLIQEGDDLMKFLIRVNATYKQQFIFIIDEWDAICREFPKGTSAMDRYVSWLRRMFKGSLSMQVFAGVYLTGILPIKKYATESAMNNFTEYSMVQPAKMAGFFGFTKEEVKALASKHQMDYDELEKWYDGYQIGDQPSIFNPNSVMQAIYNGYCRSYWGCTAASNTIQAHLKKNIIGFRDAIERLIQGDKIEVDFSVETNDIHSLTNSDEVLSVLAHLGFIAYNAKEKCCHMPNKDISSTSDLYLMDYPQHQLHGFGIKY